jgi:signal transduction histidine kinase
MEQKVDNFLDNISLDKKASFLIATNIIGILFITLIAYFSIFNIQKSVDDAYTKTLYITSSVQDDLKKYMPNNDISSIITVQKNAIEKNRIKNEETFTYAKVLIFLSTILSLTLSASLIKAISKNLTKLFHNLYKSIESRTKEIDNEIDRKVKKYKEQNQIMFQQARLASMGEMIGNIAHQWRQPLNALTLLIQSFGIKSSTGKLTQDFIDQQVDEGLRLAVNMSNTIEDFRHFFSPSKKREYFSVKRAINDALDMSEFFRKDEKINIILDCKNEIRVNGYSNEFSQVILNFINNARDNFKIKKIDYEKKIFINVEIDLENKPHAVIKFIDNGGGIDENIIDRIFEPYFTTKHKSTGTGIGLYMSKQIIETQMLGFVSVKNIMKKEDTKTNIKCAEFTISIPLE